MKTTVDIADNILEQSRRLARAKKTTLKNLVEEGLMVVLNRVEESGRPKVVPVVFGAGGLNPEFVDVSWEKVRSTIYDGRGE